MDHAAVRPYRLAPDEGEAVWFTGNLMTVKATGAQSRGALTVVEFLNPAGFAPPLHRHLEEDEMFYILDGSAQFRCDETSFEASAGDFVFLPVGLPHTFLVSPDAPLRVLQISSPSGFDEFARQAGEPATERRLPDVAPVDVSALGHAAQTHAIELLGPPPTR